MLCRKRRMSSVTVTNVIQTYDSCTGGTQQSYSRMLFFRKRFTSVVPLLITIVLLQLGRLRNYGDKLLYSYKELTESSQKAQIAILLI